MEVVCSEGAEVSTHGLLEFTFSSSNNNKKELFWQLLGFFFQLKWSFLTINTLLPVWTAERWSNNNVQISLTAAGSQVQAEELEDN